MENDPNDVHNIIKTFYSNLYEDKAISEHSVNFFLSHLTTKLNNIDKEFFERDLTTNELTKAMQSMQSNKSPGPDGLPKEFYNTFWEQLKDPLLQVFKESFYRGVLPPSLRAGSISLLFKKGDRKDLKNCRPYSELMLKYHQRPFFWNATSSSPTDWHRPNVWGRRPDNVRQPSPSQRFVFVCPRSPTSTLYPGLGFGESF